MEAGLPPASLELAQYAGLPITLGLAGALLVSLIMKETYPCRRPGELGSWLWTPLTPGAHVQCAGRAAGLAGRGLIAVAFVVYYFSFQTGYAIVNSSVQKDLA